MRKWKAREEGGTEGWEGERKGRDEQEDSEVGLFPSDQASNGSDHFRVLHVEVYQVTRHATSQGRKGRKKSAKVEGRDESPTELNSPSYRGNEELTLLEGRQNQHPHRQDQDLLHLDQPSSFLCLFGLARASVIRVGGGRVSRMGRRSGGESRGELASTLGGRGS